MLYALENPTFSIFALGCFVAFLFFAVKLAEWYFARWSFFGTYLCTNCFHLHKEFTCVETGMHIRTLICPDCHSIKRTNWGGKPF